MRPFSFRSVTAELPLLLMVSCTAAAVLALAHFVLIPQAVLLKQHRQELVRYQSLISSENGYRQIRQDIIEKIKILESRLQPPLPDVKKNLSDLGGFLETLIAVAKKSDIRFVKIQPQEETETADYSIYPVVLVLSTTYHELGRFIADIEKNPDLFTIDRIAMDATDDGRCNVRLLVSCLIPREVPHD